MTQTEVHDRDRGLPAAPLRFWLAPKLCGGRSLSGVIVASFDRVGRRFPLTVAAPADEASTRGGDDLAWFALAEATMQDAIVGCMSVDEFEAALAELPALSWSPSRTVADAGVGSLWWTAAADSSPSSYPALPPNEACMTLFGAQLR